MRRSSTPRLVRPTTVRPRQRVIAGAAFLAVAGLGATYLQALRSTSAYASTTCSATVNSLSDLQTVLGEVIDGSCDTVVFGTSVTVNLQNSSDLPVIDLENLYGPQHLTIQGNNGGLSGTGAYAVAGFEINLGSDDSLTVSDFRFSQLNAHTRTNPNGGGLSITGEVNPSVKADVTLDNLTFGSTADRGGGLYVSNSDVTINGSLFTNSIARNAGGGIYAVDSNVTVTETGFVINSANGQSSGVGGAISIKNGTLTAESSSFYSNIAGLYGGAIYDDNADLTLTNTYIGKGDTNNSGGGGGIFVKDAPVTMSFTSVVDNTGRYDTNFPVSGSGIHINSPADDVAFTGVLVTTTDTEPNCGISANSVSVAYSVADDGSCSFGDLDDATSADEQEIKLQPTNGGDRHWNPDCQARWLRSRMPSSDSWAVLNAPTSATGMTEDLWGVPRSGTFTIGARQYIAPPAFTDPTADTYPDGTTGVAYTAQTASAGNGPHLYYTATGVPPGLNFNGCTGRLSGSPSTAGTYNTVITAYGPGGQTAATTQSILIVQGPMPPWITAGPTTSGQIGVSYSSSFTATGYPAPTFTLNNGSGPLPPGLTLSSAGAVTGTPTTEGIYTFTAKASNGNGFPATRSATITIGKVPPTFTKENATSPVTFGDDYSYTYEATGTAPITFSLVSGDLPAGVTLNASTGVLSGKPTFVKTYTFTIRATNGAGSDTTLTQTIVVRPDFPDPPVVLAKPKNLALDLTWNRPASGSSPITKYKIVATPGGKSCEVNATSATSYSCTISGLKNGTPYTLKAQSYSTVGWSEARTVVATPCTVPNMPRKITVESKTADGVVKLSWDVPSYDGGAKITGYVVFWRLRDALVYTQMPPVTTLSRTITGLKAGKIYRIAVAAKNLAGRSDTKTFIIVKVPKS